LAVNKILMITEVDNSSVFRRKLQLCSAMLFQDFCTERYREISRNRIENITCFHVFNGKLFNKTTCVH